MGNKNSTNEEVPPLPVVTMNLMTNKQPEYPAPLQIEAGSSGKGSGESCGLDLCCGCFECDFGCCA